MNLKILKTEDDKILAFVRVVIASVVMAHGLQKLLGWFGGHGVEWTVTMWSQWFGLPAVATMLVILGESAGTLLLLVGLLSRAMAGVIGLIMIGAVYFVHLRSGFFMNWYAQPQGEGFEYHILMMTLVIIVVIRGGGSYSLDRWLYNRYHQH